MDQYFQKFPNKHDNLVRSIQTFQTFFLSSFLFIQSCWGGGERVKKWFQGRSWRVVVINIPLGRAFAIKKKKKEKKRKHARLTVLHDLLLQQTELQSFKSNTRIVFGNSPLLACAWFSYFLPKKSTASIFSLFASFAAHNCPVISATAKFKSQNHFFVCLLSLEPRSYRKWPRTFS